MELILVPIMRITTADDGVEARTAEVCAINFSPAENAPALMR